MVGEIPTMLVEQLSRHNVVTSVRYCLKSGTIQGESSGNHAGLRRHRCREEEEISPLEVNAQR
jgi:hypothetical protein